MRPAHVLASRASRTPAIGRSIPAYALSDDDFKRLIAILRLSVPYTGMILTAREPAALRRELLDFGCSQIDGGTRIEIGGYSEGEASRTSTTSSSASATPGRSTRSSASCSTWARSLVVHRLLPQGRTGEHFMEFAIPGFIKRFCTPNALLTLKEYLIDYASPTVRAKGDALIAAELAKLPEDGQDRADGAPLRNRPGAARPLLLSRAIVTPGQRASGVSQARASTLKTRDHRAGLLSQRARDSLLDSGRLDVRGNGSVALTEELLCADGTGKLQFISTNRAICT